MLAKTKRPETSTPFTSDDLHYMRTALALARRGLGRVWPNPAVGCLLVRDGIILSRGWTQPGGRPHAEAEALARLPKGGAKGATAYVSLEPCSHTGDTPPCTDALVAAGVARVVVAVEDPDPRVAGQGIGALKAAGLTVDQGLMEKEARALNAGFFLRLEQQRPLVTLKLATSADGFMARDADEDQWITGAEARRRGHLMRAENDAILVGVGTLLADDPMLTCRLPGLEDRSPVRVVLDSDTAIKTPASAGVIRSAGEVPTWIVTAAAGGHKALEKAGATIISLSATHDLRAVLAALAGRGITRLMVEGGAAVLTSFLEAGLADRVAWFRAPLSLGEKGRSAIMTGPLTDPARFERTSCEELGDDTLENLSAKV